jgi:nitroreductase
MLLEKTIEDWSKRPELSDSKNMELFRAIHSAQHCQRNYDLSQKMPIEDIKTLVTAATKCPSKQNIKFYKLHVITNRDVIEKVYDACSGMDRSQLENNPSENPQVLGNLVFVFEKQDDFDNESKNSNPETKLYKKEEWATRAIEADTNQAIGVAAGMVNLSAAQLGYGTGCCACIIDMDKLKQAIGAENKIGLVMGIGFRNKNKNRLEHHKESKVTFISRKKQEIPINYMR